MNRIKAEIIADSLNEYGQRITTFVLEFPRIVLAEFNTHRMLSRNSASSRAIPFKTMVEKVTNEPFIPIGWQKEHKGMQGNEYHDGPILPRQLDQEWLIARDSAVLMAKLIHDRDVSKQVCNRLLEPFLYHKCICTATEWENFFALRAEGSAEIHIQDLAYKMLDAYNVSTPKQLKAGEWHIPFGDKINLPPTIPIDEGYTLDEGVAIRKVKIATARCARVSYLNFEGKDDYTADIKLHDTLLKSGHMSPFEHCAKAMDESDRDSSFYNNYFCGNFKGFVQYRKTIENENKRDTRVITK